MPEVQTPGFKIYPRGFAGRELPIRLAERPKPYELRIRSAKQIGLVQSVPQVLDANQVIETLYSQYIKRSADTKSFEFREAVLIATLQAFGAGNFYSWYITQLQLPTISEEHVRFLGDICRFILTGTHEFTLETWSYLLRTSSEGVRPFKPCEQARCFFAMTPGYTQSTDPSQYSLTNVVQRWVAQPQGIEDLLGTLHLLFGNP
jgi:hypothetical protein